MDLIKSKLGKNIKELSHGSSRQIFTNGNKVIKLFCEEDMYLKEVKLYKFLSKTNINIPEYYGLIEDIGVYMIIIEYVGDTIDDLYSPLDETICEQTYKKYLPKNLSTQIDKIMSDLDKLNLVMGDFHGGNFTIKNNIVYLIDLESLCYSNS